MGLFLCSRRSYQRRMESRGKSEKKKSWVLQLLQIGRETKEVREARQVTTAMAHLLRKDVLLQAQGEETGRRTLFKWLEEHKEALTTGWDRHSRSYHKSVAGPGPKTKERRKKRQNPPILANGFQRKNKFNLLLWVHSLDSTSQFHLATKDLGDQIPKGRLHNSKHHSHRCN